MKRTPDGRSSVARGSRSSPIPPATRREDENVRLAWIEPLVAPLVVLLPVTFLHRTSRQCPPGRVTQRK